MREDRSRSGLRVALGAYLLLLLYDGALRKWVLPSAEQLLFVLKDGVLALSFATVLPRVRQLRNLAFPVAPRTFALLYAAWAAVQVGNLALPTPLVGIWGLKSHLLYASLVFLVPAAFESTDELLRTLTRWYTWIVVPIAALGFAQLAAGPDAAINRLVRGGQDDIAQFGDAGLVRVTGTFSYISGMSAFVQAASLLGILLFLAGGRQRSFLVGLGFALAALPATGSRGVIAVVAGSALMMLLFSFVGGLITARVAARLVVATTALGAISYYSQADVWEALRQRAEGTGDDGNRAFTAFTNAFHHFDAAGVFGFGTGAANFGAVALVDVRPWSWLPPGTTFEEESGRIVLELGILGWLFSVAMRASFVVWSGYLAVASSTRAGRVIGTASFPTMLVGLQVGNGVFAPPLGASFYWLCVAMMAMAHHEHLSSTAAARAAQAQRRRPASRAPGGLREGAR